MSTNPTPLQITVIIPKGQANKMYTKLEKLTFPYLVFKSLGSVIFFFIGLNTFVIFYSAIKLIKSDRRDIYNVTKDLYFR